MEQTGPGQAGLGATPLANADPPPDAVRVDGLLATLSSVAGAALRRVVLVSAGGIGGAGILAGLTAAYAVAPAHGGALAAALGVSAFSICAAATIVYALASSVVRAAAEIVRRQRFAEVILERVFAAACRAAPSLAGHDVSRGLTAEEWAAVKDGIVRTRASMCGSGGIRGRVIGWLFDAVARRVERSLRLVLGDVARPGEALSFGGVPAFAARLVNEAVATMLDAAARRLLVVWVAVVFLALGLVGAVSAT